MNIQWYPGHMHKANKEIKELLPLVDVIIEVLDARIPFSSENPLIQDYNKDIPSIKILNKVDLADPVLVAQWQAHFESLGHTKTVLRSNSDASIAPQLLDQCKALVPNKAAKEQNIHALIMGIPNVGKSTIINSMVGRQIAHTGNEPAVTKRQQRIKLDNGIVLYDTPGFLWPNIENKHSGYRLAFTGGIKNTAYDVDDIAFYSAEYLLAHYAPALMKRFELEEKPQSEMEFFEAAGRRRGCLKSGGHVDLDRIYAIFINEFREGQFGGITLETPAMGEKEWADVLVQREKKAAKKKERVDGRKAQKKHSRRNRK